MWFLLFIKQLPVIAIAEVKEIIPPRMRHGHGRHDQAIEHGGMANPLTAGGHHTTGDTGPTRGPGLGGGPHPAGGTH
jgi:hypothetical protein